MSSQYREHLDSREFDWPEFSRYSGELELRQEEELRQREEDEWEAAHGEDEEDWEGLHDGPSGS